MRDRLSRLGVQASSSGAEPPGAESSKAELSIGESSVAESSAADWSGADRSEAESRAPRAAAQPGGEVERWDDPDADRRAPAQVATPSGPSRRDDSEQGDTDPDLDRRAQVQVATPSGPSGSDDPEQGDADAELHRRSSRTRGAQSGAWRSRAAGAVHDRMPPTLQSALWALDGRSVLVIAAVGAAAVAVALLLFGRSPHVEPIIRPSLGPPPGVSAPAVSVESSTAPVGSGSPTVAPTGVASVVVDVAGLVVRPGVYELPAGSRVVDAVAAAGGAIEGTDLSQLNLARLVVDGEQVAVGVPPAPAPVGGAGGGTTGAASSGPSAPLDLNIASESELDSLPGVGPVLAARIIAWRQEHGRFTSVQELLEVSGIGEATLADIAPLVRV